MIQNLNLGPPATGLSALKAPLERNSKDTGSESFGKSLEQKMLTPTEPKQATLPKSLGKEARIDEKAKPQKEEEAEKKVEQEDSDEPLIAKIETREAAIKKFMDSFESEFDIPPTRLVEAIANLKDQDLLKSPEETADAVIAELDLAPEQQEKAQAMYAALLLGLSQAPPVQAAAPPTMLAAGQVLGSEFRQRAQMASDQRSMMNMGIDRLNQKFWNKEATAEPALKAVPNSAVIERQSLLGDESSNLFGETMEASATAENADLRSAAPAVKGPLELPPHLRGQLEQSVAPAGMMAALAAKMAELKAQGESSGEEVSTVEDPPSEKVAAPPTAGTMNIGKPSAEIKVNASDNAFTQGEGADANSGGSDFAKNIEGQNEKISSGEKLSSKNDFKQSLKSLGEMTPQGMPLKADSLKAAPAPVTAAGAAALAASIANPAENETNVRQLMNQAQYLIKKGGGEVNVQMTPEGLGNVHLKLMLQDGKVNVQMSAATEEAKKTIESSLAELKTSLAAHKLSVEHVKVDVVGNVSADVATHNQSQTNSDPQRDGTRQFWNQFNDNFGSSSQRESFQEMGNLKGYTSAKRDPLQPIETSASKTRSVEGKGKGLNLVA